MARKAFVVVALLTLFVGASAAQSDTSKVVLRRGAKVFIAPMPDGFDSFLKSAFVKKKVPLSIVDAKDSADFEITGSSETQKAGAAKKVLMLDFHSDEQASIRIAHLKSGEVVFAYSVNKKSSAHGKQSTAEACAVHIKDELGKR